MKLLTGDWDKPNSWALDTYKASGGYKALPKALKMQPHYWLRLPSSFL